jgi:hypothetical protein
MKPHALYILCVASMALAGCGSAPEPRSAGSTLAPGAENLPTWTVDANIAPQLSEKFESKRLPPALELQMPKKFSPNQREVPHHKMLLFFAPARKDRSGALFMINAMSTKDGGAAGKPETAKSYTLKEAMDLVLKTQQTARSHNWKVGPMESGLVNGQKFMRVYWSGDEPGMNKPMQGFIYGTVFNGDFVQFAAQDMSQYANEALPALDNAVRTVHFDPPQ